MTIQSQTFIYPDLKRAPIFQVFSRVGGCRNSMRCVSLVASFVICHLSTAQQLNRLRVLLTSAQKKNGNPIPTCFYYDLKRAPPSQVLNRARGRRNLMRCVSLVASLVICHLSTAPTNKIESLASVVDVGAKEE